MDRITGANTVDLGGGKLGFRARDTGAGVQGTVLTATWCNGAQEELLAIIEAGGLVPTEADRAQALKVIRSAVRAGLWTYAAAGGTANALTAALALPPDALTAGMSILVKIAATNTGPATINVNGLGAVSIRRRDGAQLAAGQLPAGGMVRLDYDGTYWQMVPLATSASAGLPILPYVAATGGANALVADFDPALTGLSAGLAIEVKVGATNTGAATINVNSLGAKTLKRSDGTALQAGDLVAGQVALMHYDGAAFQVATVGPPRSEMIYVADTGAANALVVAPSPAVGAYAEGLTLLVKVAAQNTGAATINVSGLGTKPILHRYGQPVVAGELLAGEMVLMVYDGASFRLVQSGRMRPGLPDWWPASSPPAGALECNGAAVSRTAYAALFGAIGTTFGAGDGATTFNVPDDRALFRRGWDNGRGLDPARTFGSEQADDFKAHTHAHYGVAYVVTGGTGASRAATTTRDDVTGSTGGTETRPRNRTYLPIIWF